MTESAYVHVPFCRSICAYCDFARWGYQESLAWDWLKQIEKECKEKLQAPLRTLYIGGGTPNALTAVQLDALLALFDAWRREGMEYTIEANPELADETFFTICQRHGVNRLSFGVQSFHDDLLQRMGRKHTAEQVKKTLALAHAHGIHNVSIDLMYALPDQTMAMWLEDLHTALTLPISHISLYSLTIEENSVFGKRGVQKGEDELEYQMYAAAIDVLQRHGFSQYEVANFAKAGAFAKHNLVYWNYENFHGIGCGASGKEDAGRYDNTRSLKHYLQAGADAQWTLLDRKEQMFEAVMMGLRLRSGIDLDAFAKRFGTRLEDHFASALQKHLGDRLLIEEGHLHTSVQGQFVLHDILVDFL